MYIKSIRIKNFRSIWDDDILVNDLSILTGWNDAWKSNYLKALNLFFNNETDFNVPFNFSSDLNKFSKFWAKQAQEIEIIVELSPPSTYKLPRLSAKWFPEPKLKWRKIWRRNWLQKDDDFIVDSRKYFTFEEYKAALKADWIVFKSKLPEWLRNISYRYIPAIKSNDYFSSLLRDLYKVLSEANVTWIQAASSSLITTINTDTIGFAKGIKQYLWLESEIALPQDLWWLFESLDIITEHWKKKISMNSRWDGIKTRHIPSLVKYFADEMNKNRGTWSPKISTIWGYEEPENNIEMLRAFDLADEFKEYAKDGIQVFLTTHSPAFYNLLNEKNEAIVWYEIEQDIQHISKAKKISSTTTIDGKMWLLKLITPYVTQEREEVRRLSDIQISLEEQLLTGTNPMLITEWKTDKKYIRKAIDSLGITMAIDFIDDAQQPDWNTGLLTILRALARVPNTRKIFWLFDRDVPSVNNEIWENLKDFWNNVYAFLVKKPLSRIQDDISIEYLFSDDEIKQILPNWTKLYFWNDFSTRTGRHNTENGVSLSQQSDRWKNKIVENNSWQAVYDINENNLLAKKDDFADAIIDNIITISDQSWENFRHIFDIIESEVS